MIDSEIQGEQPAAAILRVVKGDPTPEELAAVLVVLSASAGSTPAPTGPQLSGWSAYWRNVRAPLVAGPGAWRSSGRLG